MCRNSLSSPFVKQCLLTASLDFSSVCIGATMGFPAILLPRLRAPLSTIKVTQEVESWIVSVHALGMFCGHLLLTAIAERLGRRAGHLLVCTHFILGFLTITFAADVMVLIIGRIVIGITSGVICGLRMITLGECTSPRNRGAFLATLAFSQSAGVLLVHYLGSILSWQRTALACTIFPFVSFILTLFTPESPSWFLSRGKYDKFEEAFRWYRGGVEEAEMRSMLRATTAKLEPVGSDNINANTNFFGNLREFIIKTEFLKPIIIMLHVNIMYELAGAVIMYTHSTFILKLVMGPNVNVYFWTVIIDIFSVIANLFSIFFIRKLNRRTVLFSAGGLSVICYAVLIGYLYGRSESWFQQAFWTPLLFLSLQVFSSAAGMFPIRNALGGELFPLRYRSIAGSISFSMASSFLFIVLKTFPALVDGLKLFGAYIVYGSIVTYSMVILWFMLPETKGRTLQEIEDEFKGKELSETHLVAVELINLPINGN